MHRLAPAVGGGNSSGNINSSNNARSKARSVQSSHGPIHGLPLQGGVARLQSVLPHKHHCHPHTYTDDEHSQGLEYPFMKCLGLSTTQSQGCETWNARLVYPSKGNQRQILQLLRHGRDKPQETLLVVTFELSCPRVSTRGSSTPALISACQHVDEQTGFISG